MICPPCGNENHANCPELARQLSSALTETEKAASNVCDCQHSGSAQERYAGRAVLEEQALSQ